MLSVLIIDDDRKLFELLAEYLERNDVVSSHAPDARAGLAALESGTYDAVLLDVMMPGVDGLEALRRIREASAIPVIMLTAKGDETDRVVGLELGADDYIAKPFSPRELLARLRAVLRRAQPDVGARLSSGGVEVELAARTVRRNGEAVELTGLEFDVLVALLRRPGRIVARDMLFELAGRGSTHVSDRAVDVHISHLRRKLGDDSRAPRLIKTVRGVGYMFVGTHP